MDRGRCAGSSSPITTLSAAVRRLERRGAQVPTLVEPAVKAMDAALQALDEASGHLEHALRVADPRSGRTGAHRGAAVCAPRRRPQIQFPGRCAQSRPRTPKNTMPTWPDRCGSRAATRAGEGCEKAQSEIPHRRCCEEPFGGPRARPPGLDKGAVNAEVEAAEGSSALKFQHSSRAIPPLPVQTGSIASSSGSRPIPAPGPGR